MKNERCVTIFTLALLKALIDLNESFIEVNFFQIRSKKFF